MIRISGCVLAGLSILLVGRTATAMPSSGAMCAQCHSATTGRMDVAGNTTTKNLGSARLDGLRPGPLKTFIVKRGKTARISIDVLNGSATYAAAVVPKSTAGLQKSRTNRLSFKADSKWSAVGSPRYYVSPGGTTRWNGARKRLTFALTVDAKTPADYYELYVTVAGLGGGKWGQTQRIYVQVIN